MKFLAIIILAMLFSCGKKNNSSNEVHTEKVCPAYEGCYFKETRQGYAPRCYYVDNWKYPTQREYLNCFYFDRAKSYGLANPKVEVINLEGITI